MIQIIDKTLLHNRPLQNISAIDRSARIVIGATLIGAPFFLDIDSVNLMFVMLPLIGIVPLMSGIIGWCPVHAFFHTKSCGTDKNNACGTLPYQFHRLFHK